MIDTTDKLPALDKKLIELLESLDPEDWSRQTVAKLWTVKDVAAHLLDGNMRILSNLRDRHQGESPVINSYQDLLDYLNRLNREWVQAMKRVSPKLLIDLLKLTGEPFHTYYASLDPHAKAAYAVAWAGEMESSNWMHIAREYTEKFLHQQQIRDAVGKQGIMNQEYYLPFLDVCMYALPHTLRNTQAKVDTLILLKTTGKVCGAWAVKYDGKQWKKVEATISLEPHCIISIDSYAAWKLFSKSLRPTDLKDKIEIHGNQDLGRAAVEMVSFMA